jgi:hypothetical protein
MFDWNSLDALILLAVLLALVIFVPLYRRRKARRP